MLIKSFKQKIKKGNEITPREKNRPKANARKIQSNINIFLVKLRCSLSERIKEMPSNVSVVKKKRQLETEINYLATWLHHNFLPPDFAS